MLEVAVRKQLDGFRLDSAFRAGGEVVVLFGPSGAGKTLTLRAIAGTLRPDEGRIVLDGRAVYDSAARLVLPPQRRHIGYVPQQYALFPHLTASDNIGFGLRGLSRRERGRRIAEMLDLFGLWGVEHRRPHELSGGQQQRVALARALAVRPRLLLLDEPFAALDAPLREALRQELLQIRERFGLKIVLVTHDLTDAFVLGHQVVVYDNGRVIQQGTRDEVFFRPASRRVAQFVGTGNILPAVVERSDAHTLWLRWQGQRVAAAPGPFAAGSPVYLCIRPTQILVVRPERRAERERENLLSCVIVGKQMQAETYTLHLRLDHSEAGYDLELALPAYVYHRLALDVEQQVVIELRRQYLHVMPRDAPSPPIFESNP
jgi:molybdate transport system ATP-binding protein